MSNPFIHRLLPAACALAALTSCENKELCFDHDEHTARYATRVSATYDLVWEQPDNGLTDWQTAWNDLGLGFGYDDLRPGVPEGIRMTAFNADGTRTEANLPPAGDEVYLPGGENSLLFYNNDTELIVFYNLGSYAGASATTRSRYRSSYKGNPLYAPQHTTESKAGENTVAAPDVLFGHYTDSYLQQRDTRAQQLDITMHPLVFTYVIRYRIKSGYDRVALARGALSGMARSVFLHNGHTSVEAATILYDCTLEPWGILAVVKSFGIPDYPNPAYSRSPGDFALTLEVRCRNGNISSHYFNITDQMRNQPHGGVITVDDIVIDDSQGTPGGGFDVSVDGWGEFEDVPVVM